MTHDRKFYSHSKTSCRKPWSLAQYPNLTSHFYPLSCVLWLLKHIPKEEERKINKKLKELQRKYDNNLSRSGRDSMDLYNDVLRKIWEGEIRWPRKFNLYPFLFNDKTGVIISTLKKAAVLKDHQANHVSIDDDDSLCRELFSPITADPAVFFERSAVFEHFLKILSEQSPQIAELADMWILQGLPMKELQAFFRMSENDLNLCKAKIKRIGRKHLQPHLFDFQVSR